jgi:SP family general alpha glucoside:H+ symporter-like MFS transporter
MNVVVPYMFNQDQGNWGGKIGWVFAGMGAIALVLVFLEVPETKARSFSELDTMFLEKVPTRSFKTRAVAVQADHKTVN